MPCSGTAILRAELVPVTEVPKGQARSRPSWAFALPPHAAITSQYLQSSVAPDKRWVVASRGAPMGDVRPLRHLRSCEMTGELARITTRGAREASVLALGRCAADVSAILVCQDRHGRWHGHREPPRIPASRCTAGCAGASPGRGRAW